MEDTVSESWAVVKADVPAEQRAEGDEYGMCGLSEPLAMKQLRANLFRFRPGDTMEYHNHDWQEELLCIVSGTCTLVVEGERRRLSAGDLLRFAPQPRRRLVNEGDEDCVWLAAGAPPIDDDWNEFEPDTPGDPPAPEGSWAVVNRSALEPKARDRYVIMWVTEALGLQQLRANFFRFRPGDSMYLHAHKAQEELFFIVEGEADLVVGDERRSVAAGDVVRVDKEPPRQLVQTGAGDCLWLAVAAPPVDDDVVWTGE
jgi:uncharacterized cupin superfamily protein